MPLLKNLSAPALPQAPVAFSKNEADRYTKILRLYFNQIDAYVAALNGIQGGRYMNNPYGSFSSRVNQTAALNTPTTTLLATTDFSNGVRLSSNTLVFDVPGIYNLQFSVQFENSDTQNHEVDLWFRKNGTDLVYTASRYAVPSSHGGINGYQIAVANFFVEVTAADAISLIWATNSTLVIMEAYAAITSPYARPGIPSVVLTATFISASTEF